ncbi:MAG: pyridoxal phosphate biosynthetic protein PdxJ [Bacteroidetes bacterium]|uniref:pyridoxine 5'-phosphate synthase n=1 Tax=unclassified Chitinophaga TaxID=2619133 RepID=UPI0009C7A0C8|nr:MULTISPECIES: pyridoxine 5'-phosphate synthase [unclassified Chitinophaga]MBP1650886.1 pyridoxal phosphate biosynthetic protein PdxJ [Bacteroidota bacterium]OMP80896.1 pyridoxine 5'-phosphate synthase [[Flexibacter] sp. ATCC 35208]WPV69958.1 pyridoxine 5'-phosphate synthase [Chitinophaga sp. LS1]
MTKLSVNINKFATLRNARGGNLPDILKVAQDCERFGADGITVHPRPDERHIRYQDVLDLKPLVTTEFNIEGYPSKEFIDLVLSVKPEQVTLVPDPPHAITSNTGWDTIANQSFLKEVIGTFKTAGIRVSIFLNAEPEKVEAAKTAGADRIELYTGPYAEEFTNARTQQQNFQLLNDYKNTARAATAIGLDINAGHDLNLDNLRFFKLHIPQLKEVSIGHALVCDALYLGLENTIQLYKRQLKVTE